MQVTKGFSLIEMLVVMALIGILAAIAFPSYQDSVIKGKRVTAQGDLQAAAAAMHTFRSQNFTYLNASLGASGVAAGQSPASGVAMYDLVFADGTTTNPTATTFTIFALPRAGTPVAGTGALGIDQNGARCWKADDDTTCTPGAAGEEWH